MNRAKQIWLFTNRNTMVLDEAGEQIAEYQSAMSCYSIDPHMALQACAEADVFVLAKWCDWSHPITRKEMEYLLGLRTREMDIADNEARLRA